MSDTPKHKIAGKNGPRVRTLEPAFGERRASWLELFFDLVFVLAVSQIARILADQTDLGGLVRYVVLFIGVWWAWVGFTFYADRFETDETIYRILIFAGMLAVAGTSVTLGGAFTPAGDVPFIVCYILARLVLITLYARTAVHIPLARAFSLQYPLGLGIASAVLVVSLAVEPPARYAIWGLALLLEFATPLINLRAARVLPIDQSHIPERFGLFTIIVLGEAVMATAIGAKGVDWNVASIAVACMGFTMAAAIWWITFEFVEDTGLASGSLKQRFAYIYGHFFVVSSIVAVGIGIEHAISEASEPHLHFSTTALIIGGITVYLTVITAIRLITGTCKLVLPRVAAVVVLISLLFLGSIIPPWLFVAVALLLLTAEIFVEQYYSEGQADAENVRAAPCEHAEDMSVFQARSRDGCEECVRNNYKWVHLRLCLSCGHVGCCDSSIHKHAANHFHTTGHPIIGSLHEDEQWAWCYVDERYVPIDRRVEL